MKKSFFALTALIALALPGASALAIEGGKKIDFSGKDALYYSGASLVSSVKRFVLPDQQVSVTARVMENGAEANPSNLLISVFDASGADIDSVYFVYSGLQDIQSMSVKWVKGNKSSAGAYLTVKGLRTNLSDLDHPTAIQLEIKLTDSTAIALDELKVNEIRK